MTPQQISLVQSSFKSVGADRVEGRRSLLLPSLRDRSRGPAALPREVIRTEDKVDGDANEDRQQSPSARCHFASGTPTRRAAQGLPCLS